MDPKIIKTLEEAKALFYAWRLAESYGLLRRYFDRLPFQPEKAHADYIGLFARVLLELGKENELKFYRGELERLHAKGTNPAIAYVLGVVYCSSSQPNMEAAREIFEKIVRDPNAKDFRVKAKMMLAAYYDDKDDISSCRLLIDSIGEVEDPALRNLVEIWKAKVFRDEKNYPAAEERYLAVIETLNAQADWYALFSAKVGLVNLYLRTQERAKGSKILQELKTLFEGRNFKSIQLQLEGLERGLANPMIVGQLQYVRTHEESALTYEKKTLRLKRESPGERLLCLFLREREVDKTMIVKKLYDRAYNGLQDDKLVYYHIHSLRKRFKDIGLPAEAISSVDQGYRLTPQVKMIEEEW